MGTPRNGLRWRLLDKMNREEVFPASTNFLTAGVIPNPLRRSSRSQARMSDHLGLFLFKSTSNVPSVQLQLAVCSKMLPECLITAPATEAA